MKTNILAIEQWKAVPGFEASYEVSDLGRVRSKDRTVRCGVGAKSIAGVTLKPWAHRSGHLYVRFGKRGTASQVHLLVMAAFGPPRPPGTECRHIDDNPRNNHIDNLIWGTRRQNIDDYVRLNNKYPKSATTHATATQIRNGLVHYARGNRKQLAERFGVSINVVNNIACGRAYSQ